MYAYFTLAWQDAYILINASSGVTNCTLRWEHVPGQAPCPRGCVYLVYRYLLTYIYHVLTDRIQWRAGGEVWLMDYM